MEDEDELIISAGPTVVELNGDLISAEITAPEGFEFDEGVGGDGNFTIYFKRTQT